MLVLAADAARVQPYSIKVARLTAPPTACAIGGPPLFVLMWFSPTPFVYEAFGGAEQAPAGRQSVRLNTKAQALALGRNLVKANSELSYSVFKIIGDEIRLEGSYPKAVNAKDAKIKFRRRSPRTGGANDDTVLGVGGMGDDVWRELLERDAMGEMDIAWTAFRKGVLELGRSLEMVDEQGNPLDVGGDYADDETPEFD